MKPTSWVFRSLCGRRTNASDMVRLIEMGVDGIITNRPDILKSIVSEQ